MDEVKERAGTCFVLNSVLGDCHLDPYQKYLEYEIMNNHLPTRLRAIRLYKELVRIGRDYPNPKYVAHGHPLKNMNVVDLLVLRSYNFHGKLRRAFEKNRSAEGEDAERAIRLGEYIKQGQSERHLLVLR